MSLHRAATVFVVKDIAKSIDHYRDVLGFTVVFAYGKPTFYAGVERDNLRIHLQAQHMAERQAGQSSVYVFVTDVDSLHQELAQSGANIVEAPKDYDYGLRDFNIIDIDGNQLSFGMELKR